VQTSLHRPAQIDSPLLQFRKNVTSQCGEDGIIAHIANTLQVANKFCVEFGAWDGVHYSNCFNLLTNNAWRGIMIEANAEKYGELVKTYRDRMNVTTVNRFVDFEGPNSLDHILTERQAPRDFGLLSIDIDGNDFYIWESLVNHAPEIIVIEFNPTVPNDVVFVQEKSFLVNQGCSLLALIGLGKQKGYELAACTDWNAFFVKRENLAKLGVQDNSIDRLYAPVQDGRIFQGYDGSVHVVGMDRLLWRNMPLSSEDFQVLPRAMRVFEDAQRK
jgi:hypothetical protein